MEGACAFESTDETSCENWGSGNGWDVIFDDPLCIITSEDMVAQSQCLAVSLFCSFPKSGGEIPQNLVLF